MTTTFKTFRGLGAAIRKHTPEGTEVVLVARTGPPDVLNAKAIIYDESGMVGQAAWEAIKYDARGTTKDGSPLAPVLSPAFVDGVGVSTLGPLASLPYAQYVGGLYLEEDLFSKLANEGYFSRVDWTTNCDPSYEYRTLVYSDDTGNGAYAGRRYAGFTARVTKKIGLKLVVKITQGLGETAEIAFDLKEASHCSPDGPVDGSEKMLTSASKENDEGALYVDRSRAADLGLRGPKLPTGMDS